jgi:iron(III) transport system permease protein
MRFRPVLWLAWAVVAVAFLLPVGSLFVRSFQVLEVVERDGTVHRAVGDVLEGDEDVTFKIQPEPGGEKSSWSVPAEDVVEVRTVYGLDHYDRVFSESRTLGLLRNSLYIALGGALLALLLGLPVAWILARTNLPARAVFGALCLGPVILPPFFIALGGAREMQDVLMTRLYVDLGLFEVLLWPGVEGGTLQLMNSILVFGFVLFPLYVLVVGPALAAVPAGPWESARLLRGPGAAFRHVVVPAVLPAVVGAFVLAFLIALADFAVPDVLGFMLPGGGAPKHVFATEVFFQWKQIGSENQGRAVATGAPFVLVICVLLVVALLLLRRSPAFTAPRGQRRRPRVALGPTKGVVAALFLVAVLGVSFVLPVVGIASWTGSGAEGSAGGTEAPSASAEDDVSLFDFAGTLDRTTGAREERDRWLLTAAAAALLAMGLAIPLARQATRGGRLARLAVLTVGVLPLAVPGIVLSAGTLLFWQALPNHFTLEIGSWTVFDVDTRDLEGSILRPTLVLATRFLPFALLASWLAFRRIRPGYEQAAATLGASRLVRGWRIVTPLSVLGVLAGGLAVFVLALRELDSVMLLDLRILPIRLYDKIHFNRMGDEANLLFLCLLYLLVPALVCALLLWLWRRRPNGG